MRRRLFSLVVAVSLILAVVSSLLMVWSLCSGEEGYIYIARNQVGVWPNRTAAIWSGAGTLRFHSGLATRATAPQLRRAGFGKGLHQSKWNWLRFHIEASNQTRYLSVSVPQWLVTVGLLLPAVVHARHRYMVGRRGKHQCRSCGYDLRESPGRCPECGTPRPSST
jgi:hypothetical protein